jgi:parallel beta-helix repeat protein
MKNERTAMTRPWGLLRLAGVLLLLLTVAPNVVRAAELTVCQTGPPDCQYTSIQEAVDAAGTGDLIKVAGGTYTGVHKRGHLRQVVYIDKTVTIRGGYNATDFSLPPDPETNQTTLDADEQGRVIYITGNIEPTIEGLHITHGNAAGLGGGGWAKDAGGGVYVHQAETTLANNWVVENLADVGGGLFLQKSKATLRDNTISDNTATGWGGGGVFVNLSAATLSGNTVSGNSGEWGGGLWIYQSPATLSLNTISGNTAGDSGGGLHLSDSDAELRDNTISGNTANGWGGGGLYLDSGAPMITGNSFTGNTANEGGGLLVWKSPATLSGNVIESNTANGSGGGLQLAESDASVHDNTISSNTAYGWGGGGVFLNNSAATLKGNTISDNTANQGGGLLVWQSPATLTGNTIMNNSAEWGGGLNLSESDATLTENTIIDNTASEQGGGLYLNVSACTVHNNTISGNIANGWGGAVLLSNSDNATLSGNNIADNTANEGGGVLLWYSAATLKDNTISDNFANGRGGGVALGESAATLSGNTVNSNTANDGGGVTLWHSPATLKGNTISDNEAYGWGGGGVFLDNSAATLKDNSFSENRANEGGGLLVWQSPATLKDNLIESNHANGGGGGLQLNESANATVSDNSISDNTATHNGGGVTLWQSPSTLKGNTISGNIADWGGGLNVSESDVTLTANTITDNTAAEQGGGLYVNGSGATLRDNTISGNAANEGGGVILWQSPATLSGNTISGNSADWGGGVHLNNSAAMLSGNTITNNTATGGGGLQLGGSGATLTDNTISSNSASESGGGLALGDSDAQLNGNTVTENSAKYGGGLSLWQSPATLSGNVITGNTAEYGGGLNLGESDAALRENTISGNSAEQGGGLYLGSGDATIDGNIVSGNTATGIWWGGGGVFLNGSAAMLNDNTISENTAGEGGGLFLWQSPATLKDNIIDTNHANGGGGGLQLNDSDHATVSGNTIESNHANGDGGGVYLTNSNATLDDSTISGNSAGSGGGIGLRDSSSAIISNTVVAGNTANDYGGGISLHEGSSVTIYGARIYANTAHNDQGGGISAGGDVHLDSSWVVGNVAENNEGGGISVGGGSFYGENCIIAGNYAGTSAGGLWLYDNDSFHLVNCDVVGNDTAREGGALATAYGSQIEIDNTLIVGNGGNTGIADRDGSGSVILLSYCDTYGNSPDGMNGVTITRNDCLGTPPEDGLDPLMAGGALPAGVGPAFAGEWLSYDYRLQADSPAIDAGTPAGAPATDIEGTPRDATPDLGAYEAASGVRISPPTQTNSGARGEVVAYEATVFNGTGASDSFDLTLGGHAWDTSLSADWLGPIAHGESATFTLYSTDTVVVSATSVARPKANFDTATFTTQAFAPPQISVSPETLTSSQYVDETVDQTLAIGNGNGIDLVFDILSTSLMDDFSTDTGLWDYWGRAYRDESNGYLVLTEPVEQPDDTGIIWSKDEIAQPFVVEFRYRAGGGTGADGFVFMFYKDRDYEPWGGSCLGFGSQASSCTVPGYGIEFDNYHSGADPSANHIALIKDSPDNHLAYVDDPRTEDNLWHQARIQVGIDSVSVELDGEAILTWEGQIDRSFAGLGFVGATGGLTNWHIIDDVRISFGDDALWLSVDPVTGITPANNSMPILVTFDATGLQPGTFGTELVVQSNDPARPLVSVPVSMTVEPTADMGWVEGTITDKHTGDPLEATIVALDQPSTITTDPDTGAYTLWLDEGSHTLQVAAGGYATETVAVEITAQQGTTQDFALMLDVPVLQVSPESLHVTHESGDVTMRTLTISNNGPATLAFDLVEPGMPPVVEGVVAYYPFNGNASDESGNGNDGTVEGATLTADRFGNPDSAYSFDGNNDYVSRPFDATSGLFPNEDPFTISAWFKTSASSPEEQVIVSSHYAYAGDGYLLTIDSFNASRIRCFFSIYNQDVPVFSTDSVNDGNWHHIVCMWKEDVVYLYLDAELQDSTSAVGTVAYGNQAPFKIGHTDAAGSDSRYFFNGSIDDVTILNRAITEEEIQELYYWQGDGDVPWISTDPTSGIVPANSSVPVEVIFDASGLQPDTYTTRIAVQSNDPIAPSVSIPVSMTVGPTASMGWVEGTVTDAATANPLEATIAALGQPYTITTDPDTGAFTLWLDEGSHTLQATAEGYVTETVAVEITAQQGTTQSFALVPKPPTLWYVTPGGDDGNDCLSPAGPCATINGALAKPGFVSGDTILVATGSYTGSGDQVVRLNKDVTLTGGWDEAFTTQSGTSTLDGEGSRRGIAVNSGVTTLVDRLTVQNGYTGDGNGGGIHNSGTLSLTYCTIDGNFAYYDGYSGHGGGGIYNVGALTLISSTISNNTATDGGGGIYATNGSSTVIKDSQIFANTANNWEGGGVQVHQDSDLSISGSWVVGNAALGNDAGGIGSNSADSAYIENSIIAGNFAGGTGGGLWGGSGYHVVNSHIIGNEANGDGAAIAINSAEIEITNTLIISNTGNTGIGDQWGSGAVFLLSYCDTFGNSPDGTGSVIITRANCLGTPPEDGLDPLMAGGALPAGVGPAFSGEWLSYDYRLQAGSPAIDAGVDTGVTTDIDGNARPFGAGYDLGADEWIAY